MDYIDGGNKNMDKLGEDIPKHIVLYISNIPVGDANEMILLFGKLIRMVNIQILLLGKA